MSEGTEQLHSISRMIYRRHINNAYLDLEWNETTSSYILRIGATGDSPRELLYALDSFASEISVMRDQVKRDVLKEHAASGDRIGF